MYRYVSPRATLPRARILFAPRRCISMTPSGPASTKREGDISDAFASMSSGEVKPLPDSFRELKLRLLRGREDVVAESWRRLLAALRRENQEIAAKGPGIIPQVDFADLDGGVCGLRDEIRKRGVMVVRGVIPEGEARAYKSEVEEYVRTNPWTRAFPQHDPQVYELYWSAPQVKARSHPSLLRVQKLLMTGLWHASRAETPISLETPLTYADRLRIRQPGDAAFALGPHMDGGSVERWEPEGFGRGGVYDRVFEGEWEHYDPWDASGRVEAVTNRYEGIGPCSAFRMWQGWMSMGTSGPYQGTLLVYPAMKLSAAYTMLRPFFRPVEDAAAAGERFLDEGNWQLASAEDMTSELQGATLGQGLEFTDAWHPHLELERTMVHVPDIKAGDFVAWHCDTIHAVDKVHQGKKDSSVLYIPICPVTEQNAEYLVRQRGAFRAGTPGPDFPGGEGESRHSGRSTEQDLQRWGGVPGLKAMGLEKLEAGLDATEGARRVVERANAVLGL